MELIKNYLITLIVFLVIDFIWLGAVARNIYREELGFLLKDSFNMLAAFIFYFIFTAGILFFVINHALAISSWQYALFAGMFFGFVAYATYDLTNLSTINDWPLKITIIDLIWGTFLGGMSSYFSYIIINFISKK